MIALDEDADAFLPAAVRADARYARLLGRSQQLPFASASIDLVVCNHALEHFLNPDAVIEEIGRVLKPTGRLYISVPNGYGQCAMACTGGYSKAVVTSTVSVARISST